MEKVNTWEGGSEHLEEGGEAVCTAEPLAGLLTLSPHPWIAAVRLAIWSHTQVAAHH